MAAQDYQQLTTGDDSGAQFGRSATELIAFHGATPCDQAAFVAEASMGTTVPNIGSTGVVFSSTAQMSALFANVEAIRDLLVEKGLMASS